jgi:TolB protein
MRSASIIAALILVLALPASPAAGSETSSPYSVVFYSGRGDNQDVYIVHPGEKEPRNLTNHPAKDNCPAPSSDGEQVAFLSVRDGNFEIYRVRRDGSEPVRLTDNPAWDEGAQSSVYQVKKDLVDRV